MNKFAQDLSVSSQQITQIQQNQLIGQGTFGNVYKIIQNNVTYVIKKINKLKIIRGLRLTQLKRQVQAMKRINHQNIVKFYGFIDDPTKGYYQIKMEYCSGTNLRQYLTDPFLYQRQILPYPEKQIYFAVKVCIDFLCAFTELRSKMITNRDIKPDNIIVQFSKGGQVQAKMIDLGQARFIIDRANSICGTFLFMAPEIIDQKYFYDQKCDLWSIGQTFYQIFQGINPIIKNKTFLSLAFKQNFELKTESDYRNYYQYIKDCPTGVNFTISKTPQTFRYIIRQLLRSDPNQRIEFIDVLKLLISEFDRFSSCFQTQQQKLKVKIKLIDCQLKQNQRIFRKKIISQNRLKIKQIYEEFFYILHTNIEEKQFEKFYDASMLILKIIQNIYTWIYMIVLNMNSTEITETDVDYQFMVQQILNDIIEKEFYNQLKQIEKNLLKAVKLDKLQQVKKYAVYKNGYVSQNLNKFILCNFRQNCQKVFKLLQKYFKQ